MMRRKAFHAPVFAGFFAFLLIAAPAPTAWAAPVIDVGTFTLAPDTAGQEIEIFVTGGDPVQGLNLKVQIIDGDPATPIGSTGPDIAAVDIVTGTIFAGNATPVTDFDNPRPDDLLPQFELRSTTTESGTVAADGLLATITIDTTGVTNGVFPLKLDNTRGGDTDFAGVDPIVSNGRIVIQAAPQIIPTPTALLGGLMLLGAMGGVGGVRKRRRGR